MLEFERRVESIYGKDGVDTNKKYYTQYMSAIKFFKKMLKLFKEEHKNE